jgi:hypothetical protein
VAASEGNRSRDLYLDYRASTYHVSRKWMNQRFPSDKIARWRIAWDFLWSSFPSRRLSSNGVPISCHFLRSLTTSTSDTPPEWTVAHMEDPMKFDRSYILSKARDFKEVRRSYRHVVKSIFRSYFVAPSGNSSCIKFLNCRCLKKNVLTEHLRVTPMASFLYSAYGPHRTSTHSCSALRIETNLRSWMTEAGCGNSDFARKIW